MQRVITCMICDKFIAHAPILEMSQTQKEIHAVCERCLELWEKSEARKVKMINDYRERLQTNEHLG